MSLQDIKCGLRHDEGNAESGGGLLLALSAMAYVDFKRAKGKLVTDGAALATAEECIAFVWHGRKPYGSSTLRLIILSAAWIRI